MRTIDLTHTFDDGMPVYPGDPASHLSQIATIEKDGFTDHILETGLHVGTHMEAPLHMIEGGKYLSDIPPERFTGRGRLINAVGRSEIGAELLDGIEIGAGDIVLVMTGHAAKFRGDDYYTSFPELTEGFAQRLTASGVSIVGMDTPSPDSPPFAVHKILLGGNVLIIENLTNLEALEGVDNFTVTALPMKLHADAAPVRVIATL